MLFNTGEAEMSDQQFLELVSTVEEVAENIRRYNEELKKDRRLVEKMPYARAWYALKEDGQYLFAPSKIIGYKDFRPDAYFSTNDKDGRKTEMRLQEMATLVVEGHPEAEALTSGLSKFLGSYHHSPNKGARISIVEVNKATRENGDAEHIQAIMDLIVRLPQQSIDLLKRRVANL